MSKGIWLDDGYCRKCSECGYSMTPSDEDGNWIPANFCPNCGDDKRKSLEESEKIIPKELQVFTGYIPKP